LETPPSSSPVPAAPQRLDVPVRFRALARKDAAAAKKAVDLDRHMQSIARRAAAEQRPSRRQPLLREMVEVRVEIDALVASVMGDPLPTGAEPSPLHQVPPQVRALLAKLLGVESGPEFQPLLERKAAEWLEHGRAFDEIAAEFGFVESGRLAVHDARGALALTYNGSLVQMSAPLGKGVSRKFVYQSLYVNTVPAEGELEMKEPLRIGQRLRTTAMDTSAIRKLRVATRPRGEWQSERRTFERISTILTTRPTAWGARASLVPSLGRSGIASVQLERARAEDAARRARIELASLVERLAFERVKRDTIDVELLGLVIHLQDLAAENGAIAMPAEKVTRIVTHRAEILTARGDQLILERPGKSDEEHPRSALGSQRVVVGAPVVLCTDRGEIAALLGDVARVE
jgi:hypothetical protein